MRILVTGDRHCFRPVLAAEVLRRLVDRYGRSITIVHGGAEGVDRAFAVAAEWLGVRTEAHPARWRELGKKAGPIRNREMVDAGAKMCIAFHQSIETSRGTKDCARRAMTAGIPTYLVDSDELKPKRLLAGDYRLEP